MLRSVLAFATLVGVAATGVAAQDVIGEQEFMIACAGCHGETAKGDGPLADLLKIDTPDLTKLTENNGGEFPYEYALWVIDGRELIRMHGNTDMPVWGERFQSSVSSQRGETTDMVARGRILSLVYYLQSIQQ